jgi:hypothetical protein
MFMTNGYFSTLAVKACQCALWQGDDGYVSDGNTKRCCDQWENTNAPGVKYSGDWLDEVRNIYRALYYYNAINLSGSARIQIT